MKRCLSLLQIGDGQPQVAFRGDQRAVVQQILHVTQIGFVLWQVRGARVPPHVWCAALFDIRQPGVTLHQVANGIGVNGVDLVRKKEPVTMTVAICRRLTKSTHLTFLGPFHDLCRHRYALRQ